MWSVHDVTTDVKLRLLRLQLVYAIPPPLSPSNSGLFQFSFFSIKTTDEKNHCLQCLRMRGSSINDRNSVDITATIIHNYSSRFITCCCETARFKQSFHLSIRTLLQATYSKEINISIEGQPRAISITYRILIIARIKHSICKCSRISLESILYDSIVKFNFYTRFRIVRHNSNSLYKDIIINVLSVISIITIIFVIVASATVIIFVVVNVVVIITQRHHHRYYEYY